MPGKIRKPRYYKKVFRPRLSPDLKSPQASPLTADFFARLSHDLKTPLTIILNYSEMMINLKKDKLDKDMELMLRGIKEGAENMLEVIEGLMARSKSESGKVGVASVEEDVGKLLKGLSSFYSGVAERRGLGFNAEIQEDMPHAHIDAVSIKSAVSNLLHNAVSYTPRGGRIVLRAGCRPKPSGGHVFIEVSDTGPGIDPNERSFIFEKHFSSGRSGGKKGSGIGLWIVKNVAEAHGGRAELDSEPGKGSTFRIILPLRRAGSGPDGQPCSSSLLSSSSDKPK